MFFACLVAESDASVLYSHTLDLGEGKIPLELELFRPEGYDAGGCQEDNIVAARCILKESQL